ncbi:hypothetical protein WJR50_00950 [Catalinimonas sp. 4WD22]|uniref:hypothetical protein n=1 Tax=Catalinimonas locisalis TaxID=3133978 RepID=UPI003100D4B2
MDKIIDKKWDYSLYKKAEKLILSAVCGSVGIFEINVVLKPSEIEEYYKYGEKYIENLARKIQQSPSKYQSRHVEI